MATSPNYGWSEPDNTSLVKDGAQAMRTLGDAIDTSVWNVGFGQAGKNKIINGNFGIWQRGTSFSNPASLAYTADRFAIFHDGTGATRTISQQTFTPGTAPVAGYESQFFYRYAISAAGTGNTANLVRQYIEDVRTFAGQTVTVSFWAKAASSLTMPSIGFTQNFGSGGSGGVDTSIATSVAVTTSWQRFTYTVAVPSISGKTVGTSSALELRFFLPVNTTFTFDTWGWQVEAGSKATPFQTASGGSIQGELAMCQRYYYRTATTQTLGIVASGFTNSTTNLSAFTTLPVTMRVAPTSVDYSALQVQDSATTTYAVSAVTISGSQSTTNTAAAGYTITGGTAGRFGFVRGDSNAAAYVGFSAEL